MCYLNFPSDEYDQMDLPPPIHRPVPRLTWAVPVNITTLAANLESYSNIDSKVSALRLAHRFGSGPLSSIPQEILEMIIDEAQQLERRRIRPKWDSDFLCFQGTCTWRQHPLPYEPDVEEMWLELFASVDRCEEERLNPDDYTDDEMMEMVENHPYENYEWDHEQIDEAHLEANSGVTDPFCLCKAGSGSAPKAGKLFELSEVLKVRFGLEIYVQHEILSWRLKHFLPEWSKDENRHYISTFLTLSANTTNQIKSNYTMVSSNNSSFVREDNHLGFRQPIDPSTLTLSNEQHQRFAKAMRVLDLSPYYHLTELESMISPPSNDASLWEICYHKLPGCPIPTNTSIKVKAKKLEQYLKRKHKELSKQSWPQLQLMAVSDAVSPN